MVIQDPSIGFKEESRLAVGRDFDVWVDALLARIPRTSNSWLEKNPRLRKHLLYLPLCT